jgi:hypothetical protein
LRARAQDVDTSPRVYGSGSAQGHIAGWRDQDEIPGAAQG